MQAVARTRINRNAPEVRENRKIGLLSSVLSLTGIKSLTSCESFLFILGTLQYLYGFLSVHNPPPDAEPVLPVGKPGRIRVDDDIAVFCSVRLFLAEPVFHECLTRQAEEAAHVRLRV